MKIKKGAKYIVMGYFHSSSGVYGNHSFETIESMTLKGGMSVLQGTIFEITDISNGEYITCYSKEMNLSTYFHKKHFNGEHTRILKQLPVNYNQYWAKLNET